MSLKHLFFSGKENEIDETTSRRSFLKQGGLFVCGGLFASLIPDIACAKKNKGKKDSKGMFSNDEYLTLARTIYGEAKGESKKGKYAVGYVIKNRAIKAKKYFEKNKSIHPFYGDGTLLSACLRPGQFSCWDEYNYVTGKRKTIRKNYTELLNLKPGDSNKPNWIECIDIARKIIQTDTHNPIEDCTHFIPKSLSPVPSWASRTNPLFSIDNHLFYRLENA